MKHLVLLITVLFFGTNLFAQEQTNHRIQEAAYKAELFKKLQSNQLVMTDNQSQYDVTHYFIDLENDPVMKSFDGNVTISVIVTGPSISTMELNFINYLKVDSVFANSIKTTFKHSSNILTVNLDHDYPLDSEMFVTVYYYGIMDFVFGEYKPL